MRSQYYDWWILFNTTIELLKENDYYLLLHFDPISFQFNLTESTQSQETQSTQSAPPKSVVSPPQPPSKPHLSQSQNINQVPNILRREQSKDLPESSNENNQDQLETNDDEDDDV